MIYVLDSSAMVAYLKKEPGGDRVRDLILDESHDCIAHAANLYEVFRVFLRERTEQDARRAVELLEYDGVVCREDMDKGFWQEAALLNRSYPHASLGDCYCMALALRESGTIVTSDHTDFAPIQQDGRCPVLFIRKR
jgi:PIN domain nuclease of toxin-antitoxin system